MARNWGDIKCQKVLRCDGACESVATKGRLVAVSGFGGCVKIFGKDDNKLNYTIGGGHLGAGGQWGITFFDEERLLVSDTFANCVKMFSIQGQLLCTYDRGNVTFQSNGIGISPDGHIYVSDVCNHCVCVFDEEGRFLFTFGSHGRGDENFHYPRDLCFASDGFLYITDVRNRRVCVYDKDGKFIRKFAADYEIDCIDATDCGHLIVSSHLSHKIMVYTTEGNLVHTFGERGGDIGEFRGPTGVSVDSDGLIYIVDLHNHRVQVF